MSHVEQPVGTTEVLGPEFQNDRSECPHRMNEKPATRSLREGVDPKRYRPHACQCQLVNEATGAKPAFPPRWCQECDQTPNGENVRRMRWLVALDRIERGNLDDKVTRGQTVAQAVSVVREMGIEDREITRALGRAVEGQRMTLEEATAVAAEHGL